MFLNVQGLCWLSHVIQVISLVGFDLGQKQKNVAYVKERVDLYSLLANLFEETLKVSFSPFYQ